MNGSLRRTSVVSVVLVAAYAAVAVWLLADSLPWPLIHDAPIMHYIAWRIAHGAAPYRDLFDMNFPGTYLVHLAALRTFGMSDAGWRAFDVAWLAVTALTLAAFARPWGWAAAAGSALFFAVYHLSGGAWQAGQRDFWLVVFLILGALGVTRWVSGRASASLACGGLALGAGITIKPHALLFAGGLAAVVLVVGLRGASGVLAPLAIFLGATAVVPAAVTAWIVAVGAFPAWGDIVLHYLLPYYVHLGRPSSWAFYRWHVWIPIAVAVGLSLGHAVLARRLTVRHTIAALGVVYGLIHYFGQGKGWEYHLYPLAAFAALLAFAELTAALARRRLLGLPLAASLALALALLAQRGVEAADADWIRDKENLVRAMAHDLAALGPGETVQVLDTTVGGIHALLRLGAVQPTRFLYDFHFFHDEETAEIRALRAEMIRDLTARPPRFVVLAARGWPEGGPERIARFPELSRWLAEGYRVVEDRPAYIVYEKKRRDP
jgi:hypothetical protein